MFIGRPKSPYGNQVEIAVDLGIANFLIFDEQSSSLTIPANVTTNADEGIYEINVNLLDTTLNSSSTTTLQLTVLPVDEGPDVLPVDEGPDMTAYNACQDAQPIPSDPCADKMPHDDNITDDAWNAYFTCSDSCYDKMPASNNEAENAWDAYDECYERENPDPCAANMPAEVLRDEDIVS